MLKVWAGRVRALGLGLGAAALTACASVPAPITRALPDSQIVEAPPNEFGDAPRVIDASANLQCVPFARRLSGIEIYGDAHTWWRHAAGRYPRSNSPAPGSVLVLRGYRTANRGHVAVVARVESERVVIVDHANWLNGGEISVGVPVLDVSPANDWSQVRVWHIPGGHWGGRVYAVQGFIHPFALHATMAEAAR